MQQGYLCCVLGGLSFSFTIMYDVMGCCRMFGTMARVVLHFIGTTDDIHYLLLFWQQSSMIVNDVYIADCK